RLILSFVVLIFISLTDWWVTATILFIIAALSDVLDGYLARAWNQITILGRIMDPFVDKVLIGGTLIFLVAEPESGVTAWLTFAVIGREMFITGLRSTMEQHGIDFSAQFSGKLKMGLQSVAVPVCLLSMSEWAVQLMGEWREEFFILRTVLLWGTLIVTVYSGVEYTWRAWTMWQKRAEENEGSTSE
ncbi:MAG: CDP-diacylglycerol--glycerol-3-phosphate 3-phosphatidyltransferase, partial [Planctomycetaceae bacterium]|nr:CDP-diacylglycerol--glycerol-3-phosphate 3-phosphatidyltransferase [Planctomycetaceae bacterium]